MPTHPRSRSRFSIRRRDHRDRCRDRRGRLLIECLVGILLLSAAALAMMAGTRATSLLADDATLVTRAGSLGAAAAERTLAMPCEPADRSAVGRLPRVQVDERLTVSERLQRLRLSASLHFSPLARSAPATLALSGGKLCP